MDQHDLRKEEIKKNISVLLEIPVLRCHLSHNIDTLSSFRTSSVDIVVVCSQYLPEPDHVMYDWGDFMFNCYQATQESEIYNKAARIYTGPLQIQKQVLKVFDEADFKYRFRIDYVLSYRFMGDIDEFAEFLKKQVYKIYDEKFTEQLEQKLDDRD